MRVAAGHANREIVADPIVSAEGDSSGSKIKATGAIGRTDIRELAEAGSKKPPTILWYRRRDRGSGLAFSAGRSGKAFAEAGSGTVNREAGRAESITTRSNVF